MKHSLRHGGGYLSIDHRESPGLTPADVAHVPNAIPVGKGQQLEADAYVCPHCQRGVLVASTGRLAKRRGYCPKCDHYICNSCAQIQARTNAPHLPFMTVIDRAAEVAVKFAGQPDHPLANPTLEELSAPPAPRITLTDAV